MALGLTGVPLVDFLVTVAALLLAVIYYTNKKDPRYPPGPTALPFLGNLLQLGTQPHRVLWKWKQEYGPVYSVKMGSEDTIMLNDYKIIKEIFAENSSTGRTENPIMVEFGGGGNFGVIMSEGAHWEAQRRFTLRKLRDFGFAKSAMEGMILEEANSMLNWFEKRLDKPISGNRIFNGAVVNSLWSIMSGEREEWDAPQPPKILHHAEGMIEAINRMYGTGLYFTPGLRHIAPTFFGWTAWMENIAGLSKMADKTIKKHDANLDPNAPQDLIDHYLVEQRQTTDPNSSFYKATGDKNLNVLIPDLFIAGSETTSNTLTWAMLYLAHYPKVQEKLQRELDTVVGRNRHASVSDRPNLPYTEAVAMELLRKPAIATLGVPHRMTQDVVFQGYLFPKNTTVISNLWLVQNDPKVWGDPENFRPERFLSPDEKKVVKHEAFIPFSVGKRQCLGKSLAEDTLFLFLAAIFQKYTMKPDPASTGDELKEENVMPSGKLLNEAPPFKVVVSLRE